MCPGTCPAGAADGSVCLLGRTGEIRCAQIPQAGLCATVSPRGPRPIPGGAGAAGGALTAGEPDSPDKGVSPETSANEVLLGSDINKALRCLTIKEASVIRLRFGLDCGRRRTLEEVGKILGVTRERVRQLEHRALKKLRQPGACDNLKDYFAA